MKRINKINILGYTYDIIYTNDANKLTINNVLCYGSCCPVEQVIYINTNQAPEQQIQTLLHEIIHCVDYITSGNEGFKLEEKQTDLLATGLASILLNNNWRKFVSK